MTDTVSREGRRTAIMTENFIILEDSSKFHFGGGQKISLAVASLLRPKYKLFLLDCSGETLFQNKIMPLMSDVLFLRCFGRFKQGRRGSFNIGNAELLLTLPLLFSNVAKILSFLKSHSISKSNAILYATTKKALLTAFLINKLRGIDYCYHAHTVDDRSSLYYRILEVLLRNAKAIICVSKTVMDNISLPQCHLIYNPVPRPDHLHLHTVAGRERIVVASFSSLIPLKGIDYFMQSHQYLRNQHRVDYWIFGEGSEKDRLHRYETSQVLLKGFTMHADEILRNHVSIVVAPTVIPESFGMSIAEALAWGIPVITTNIGAQAELVRDGHVGYQVPVRDPRAIAEKIDLLIENFSLYSTLSENAYEQSKAYDAPVFSRAMLNLLEQLD